MTLIMYIYKTNSFASEPHRLADDTMLVEWNCEEVIINNIIYNI